MTRDRSIDPASGAHPARSVRRARIVAGGFIGAFGASILTVIYTGLHVGAPRGPKMGNTVATTPAKGRPGAKHVGADTDSNSAKEREPPAPGDESPALSEGAGSAGPAR